MGKTARIEKLEKKLRKLKAKLKAAQDHTHVVSPLAPDAFPALPVIDGVRFAAVEAGVKYQKAILDGWLIELFQKSRYLSNLVFINIIRNKKSCSHQRRVRTIFEGEHIS